MKIYLLSLKLLFNATRNTTGGVTFDIETFAFFLILSTVFLFSS